MATSRLIAFLAGCMFILLATANWTVSTGNPIIVISTVGFLILLVFMAIQDSNYN